MHVPRLNINCSAASHAHPLPTRLSPQALEEQRIRALIARQTINVNLCGLSCEHAVTVSDILTPKIRRSPFNEQVTASHLDLSECWKGLSHSQATELLMWYQFLHKSLESEVRVSLCNDLVKGLLESAEPIDEVFFVPRMLEYLKGKRHRVIDVNFVDLIDSMMGMFHDQFPHKAAAVSSHWSHFSGGLSLFLQNFLRIQDCFKAIPEGQCLVVDFEFQYIDSVLKASGEVTWQLPEVRFLNLPNSRLSGEEYRITPFLLKDLQSPVSSPGCDDYVDEVTYTIPRSAVSFGWDAMKQCFRTILPDSEDGEAHTIETVFSATVVTPFPNDVQFQRQSRWGIKLDVAPADSDYTRSMIHAHENVKLSEFRKGEIWNEPFHDALQHRTQISSSDSEQTTVLRHIFDTRRSAQSPQKRKVSKPEVFPASLDTKRRRRDSTHDCANEPPLLTRSDVERLRAWYRLGGTGAGESASTVQRSADQDDASSGLEISDNEVSSIQKRTVAKPEIVDFGQDSTYGTECEPPRWTESDLDKMRAAVHGPYQCLQVDVGRADRNFASTSQSGVGSSSQISTNEWSRRPRRCDELMSPPSTDDSAPESATEKAYTALQQEQILRNYQEFTELKPYKDAGIISPVSEDERRVFESIFLEDEQWSPVYDGSADLDTVMGDL
ncbi:hypothetical protein EJ07DRAFT_152512 [Lizonia empirigonia]|nr:hypothetical protein EJ07DRAFT_152512 [Lizonia empirigonia]